MPPTINFLAFSLGSISVRKRSSYSSPTFNTCGHKSQKCFRTKENPLIQLKERFKTAVLLTKRSNLSHENTKKVHSFLYLMADKFLNPIDMQNLKEELRMLKITEMFVKEGIAQASSCPRY